VRRARQIVLRKKEVDLDRTPLLSEPILQRKVHTLSSRASIPELARFDTVCTPPSRLSDSERGKKFLSSFQPPRMSSSRSGRIPAYQRAEQNILDEVLRQSQVENQRQQQQLNPFALPSLTAPFQTLHGTLDNTTYTTSTSQSAPTPLRDSSSSDRLPSSSSLHPILPAPPRPLPSAGPSSISDPDTSLNRQGVTASDEIRNSFTTSDQSKKQTSGMSSEIGTFTTDSANPMLPANGGGVGGEEEAEQIPDSDNEGSGPGMLTLSSLKSILES